MRCLVVANDHDADPGFVGDRLRHHGFALTSAAREHPRDWPALGEMDLVLLLGSEWSVYWDDVATSVAAECALVREASDTGVPVLGICFGAQVVSHTFGGSVARASRPEVGWYDIESDLPDVIAPGPWLQWHYDTFTVPAGFECVARNDVGPQAIRRDRILCTQFHPEATEAIVAQWSSGSGVEELARFDTTSDILMEATRRHIGHSRGHSDRLVDWFLADVARL